jgi:hypothetical protein
LAAACHATDNAVAFFSRRYTLKRK